MAYNNDMTYVLKSLFLDGNISASSCWNDVVPNKIDLEEVKKDSYKEGFQSAQEMIKNENANKIDALRAENSTLFNTLLDIAFGDHKTDLSVMAYKALGGRIGEFGQLLDTRETLTCAPAVKDKPATFTISPGVYVAEYDLTGCAYDGGTAE